MPTLIDDETQIDQAARGCCSGTLREWPGLAAALRRRGFNLPPATGHLTLTNLCRLIVDRPSPSNADGQWQSLATMPLDGRLVLLTDGLAVAVGKWDAEARRGRWIVTPDASDYYQTDFVPLRGPILAWLPIPEVPDREPVTPGVAGFPNRTEEPK